MSAACVPTGGRPPERAVGERVCRPARSYMGDDRAPSSRAAPRRAPSPSSLGRFDPGSGPGSARIRGNTDDRLLAPLRRHRGWTFLGLIVAAVAMANAVCSDRDPSSVVQAQAVRARHREHQARARGELVVRIHQELARTLQRLATRTYALAEMVASPEITEYVARAAGLPVSKIGILDPSGLSFSGTSSSPRVRSATARSSSRRTRTRSRSIRRRLNRERDRDRDPGRRSSTSRPRRPARSSQRD